MNSDVKQLFKEIKRSRDSRYALSLKKSIKYSEYICENLDKSIEYSEYLAENLDRTIPVGTLNKEEVDKLINQVLNPKPKSSIFQKLIRTFVK